MTTYRTGRHNERTIYIQGGLRPERTDVQVGTMDTPELGRLVVYALNTMNCLVGGRAEVPSGRHVCSEHGCSQAEYLRHVGTTT